jgi:SAM-dependent methyltransferase
MSQPPQSGRRMQHDALYQDAALAQFYDWDNPWPDEFDFFASLIEPRSRVLDLGCGTGIFSVALAQRGHQVTGADPAVAMLQIARHRPGGDLVRWVQSDACSLDLGETFEMVLMTGHAFQTVLRAQDRALLIQTIARHLRPGGQFFFDSRNPDAREWERWTPELTRETRPHPVFGAVERWNDAAFDPASAIATYQTTYRLADGRMFKAESQIAFPSQPELAELFALHGLEAIRWMGDYAGAPFRPMCPEIIPLGRRAG